jgi:hypothetical protein
VLCSNDGNEKGRECGCRGGGGCQQWRDGSLPGSQIREVVRLVQRLPRKLVRTCHHEEEGGGRDTNTNECSTTSPDKRHRHPPPPGIIGTQRHDHREDEVWHCREVHRQATTLALFPAKRVQTVPHPRGGGGEGSEHATRLLILCARPKTSRISYCRSDKPSVPRPLLSALSRYSCRYWFPDVATSGVQQRQYRPRRSDAAVVNVVCAPLPAQPSQCLLLFDSSPVPHSTRFVPSFLHSVS